jgi:hypothetical protein
MKKLLTAATLLTIIGTPAFSQSLSQHIGTSRIIPVASNKSAESAYAQDQGKGVKTTSRSFFFRQDQLYDGCTSATISVSPASPNFGSCHTK